MNFFYLLKKHFLSSNFLNFLFLGLSLIFLFVLLFFVPELIVNLPVKRLLFLLVAIFYFLDAYYLLNLIETNSRTDLEKIQVNSIIRSISDPVISYDTNFEIILVNRAMEELVGLSQKELVGKIITPEMVKDPHYRFLAQLVFPSLAPIVLERSSEGYPQTIKVKFTQPKEYIFEILTNKVIDEKGQVYGFLKIIHNLTSEEELRQTQSDFITVAAHQLKTPLAGLNWILEVLSNQEMGPLNEDQLKLIQDARGALNEALSTVEGLLEAAQVESGKLGFQFQQADLVKLIEETLIKLEPLTKQNNIKLIFYQPPAPIELIMDPFRIKLVLEILIENAIKYNVQNGEVRIKIDFLKDQPFVSVSVEDTGIGMTEEDLKKLFQKFFRASSAMKVETSGLGLGLYLAKNIVEKHGGKIWAKSVLNRGSTFTFTLPLDPSLIPKY